MKNFVDMHGIFKRITAIIFFFILMWSHLLAQLPTNYPNPESQPLDLTLKNILLYFVSPVLLVVIFFLVRRYKRKQAEKSASENEK
jgi:hypothetical protein